MIACTIVTVGCSTGGGLLGLGSTSVAPLPSSVVPPVPSGIAPAQSGIPPTADASPTLPRPETTTSTIPASPLAPEFDAIATQTSMTVEARALLAQSNPMLVDVATLAASCSLDPELSVLGCHRPGQIAVLAIDDPRLAGMTQATTAHEMLHAAWSMLSTSERADLARLLHTAYARVSTSELDSRIEAYRLREPSVVDNELHSILGTEVADLGPELDAYYQRWFTDRSAVVSLAGAARTAFVSIESQISDIDARLGPLQQRIESDDATLAADQAALDGQAAELQALQSAGQIEQYNAGVEPFNRLLDLYNQSAAALQAMIDDYNALVDERNALAATHTELVAQISTTAEQLPTG